MLEMQRLYSTYFTTTMTMTPWGYVNFHIRMAA